MYYVLLSVASLSSMLSLIVVDSLRVPSLIVAVMSITIAVMLLPTVWVTKQDEVVKKDVSPYPERKIPLRDAKGKFIKRK